MYFIDHVLMTLSEVPRKLFEIAYKLLALLVAKLN